MFNAREFPMKPLGEEGKADWRAGIMFGLLALAVLVGAQIFSTVYTHFQMRGTVRSLVAYDNENVYGPLPEYKIIEMIEAKAETLGIKIPFGGLTVQQVAEKTVQVTMRYTLKVNLYFFKVPWRFNIDEKTESRHAIPRPNMPFMPK